MKDIYKNPIFYYILVPVVSALWPAIVWTAYLPQTEKNWENEKARYEKSQKIIQEILTLDPERLDFSGRKDTAAQFNYAAVVDDIARTCKIPSVNYNISSKPPRKSGGQKTQSCQVTLKEVDITSFSEFLSTIQLRWANLQCESVKLTKKKGLPDAWKVDLDFKYYY